MMDDDKPGAEVPTPWKGRMTLSDVKNQTKALIDDLAESDVEIILQIAQRLAEWEATQEVLNSPELMADIDEGLKDIKAGRVTEWRQIQRPA